jgi:hypothetical protein
MAFLPSANKKQPLHGTLDFKQCNRCSEGRKMLIEGSGFVAARVVYLKAMNEIKQWMSDI